MVAGLGPKGPEFEFEPLSTVELTPGAIYLACHPPEVGEMINYSCAGISSTGTPC